MKHSEKNVLKTFHLTLTTGRRAKWSAISMSGSTRRAGKEQLDDPEVCPGCGDIPQVAGQEQAGHEEPCPAVQADAVPKVQAVQRKFYDLRPQHVF